MPKIEMEKKYRTRGGKDAQLLCIDANNAKPVVALVDGRAFNYYPDGNFLIYGPCHLDLLEIPEERTGWVNIYAKQRNGVMTFGTPVGFLGTDVFSTREIADSCTNSNRTRIACIPITYYVGQGLEETEEDF